MFSVLKSQKRSFIHSKNINITFSMWLTDTLVFLAFSDRSIAILSLFLGSKEAEQIIWEGKVEEKIIGGARVRESFLILLGASGHKLYSLTSTNDRKKGEIFVNLEEVLGDAGRLEGLHFQSRIHGFEGKGVVVETQLHRQRKFLLDSYFLSKDTENTIKLKKTLEVDLDTNGRYCIDTFKTIGSLVMYKQVQFDETERILHFFFPFYEDEDNTEAPNEIKQIKVILNSEIFSPEISIVQIFESHQNTYIMICSEISTGNLNAYILKGIHSMNSDIISENSYILEKIEQNPEFLDSSFLKILETDPQNKIIFVLGHQHTRIQGELYENKIQLVNLETLRTISEGYCNLKEIDFSPNKTMILDLGYQYENFGVTFYHVRLLLQKKNIYLMIIHEISSKNKEIETEEQEGKEGNCLKVKIGEYWSETFKQEILSLL